MTRIIFHNLLNFTNVNEIRGICINIRLNSCLF